MNVPIWLLTALMVGSLFLSGLSAVLTLPRLSSAESGLAESASREYLLRSQAAAKANELAETTADKVSLEDRLADTKDALAQLKTEHERLTEQFEEQRNDSEALTQERNAAKALLEQSDSRVVTLQKQLHEQQEQNLHLQQLVEVQQEKMPDRGTLSGSGAPSGPSNHRPRPSLRAPDPVRTGGGLIHAADPSQRPHHTRHPHRDRPLG